MNAKAEFVNGAININPFNTSHFGWIDVNLLEKTFNDSVNYLDIEIYDKMFVQSIKKLGTQLWQFWDNKIIDGLGPNGLTSSCKVLAGRVSKIQTGYVYHYVLAMSFGVTGILLYLIVKTIG